MAVVSREAFARASRGFRGGSGSSATTSLDFAELLKTPGLDGKTVQQALAEAGREVDSDFELGALLTASDALLKNEGTRKAYLDAARTIGSDFEMRRLFSTALERGAVNSGVLAGVLEVSTAIESDFELASLLVQVAKLQPLDNATRATFFKALDTLVASHSEHGRALDALVRKERRK